MKKEELKKYIDNINDLLVSLNDLIERKNLDLEKTSSFYSEITFHLLNYKEILQETYRRL